MARKNTKKRMQQQAQPSAPQPQQPSNASLPPQQQQPVPTWSPKRHQEQQQQQQQQQQALEPDVFGDDFFSQPQAAAAPAAIDLRWDDAEDVPRIAPDKRRAMLATIAIFSVFAVAVGGFILYTQVIMPTPVTLGASSGTMMLPQAAPIIETPVVAAPIVAPVAVAEPAAVVEAAPVAAAPLAEEATVAVAAAPVEAAPVAVARVAPVARVERVRNAAPTPVADNSLSAQAMRMLNGGHAADARRLAQQAVQSNPERAEGWIVLGAANASLGDAEAAKTAYANCTARATGPRVATCRALAR